MTHRRRQRGQKPLRRQRTEQTNLENADPFTALEQPVDGLVRAFRSRSHQHDHALGFGMAVVVERAVAPARQLLEPSHDVFEVIDEGVIKRIGRFPRLKEGVRILRRSAHDRPIRRQSPGPMVVEPVVVDQS